MIKDKMLMAISSSYEDKLQYNGNWDLVVSEEKAAEKCEEICHEEMVAFAKFANRYKVEFLSEIDGILKIYLKEKENEIKN